MRGRSTLGEQPSRKFINSIERKTMTNQTSTQFQARQIDKEQQAEKMTKAIHDVLMKVPNQGKRTSISNIIKPSSGVFLSYIGSLMTLIDRMFDKGLVNTDTVQQLISFWGYP